jgi:hypothetical protein
MAAPGDRRDDVIRGGSRFPEQRVIVRAIVDAARDAADFSVANKTSERHPHGTRITEIGEVMWREGPATTLLRHAAEDDLALGDGGSGRFHVENNDRFFQQIKVGICIGFMLSFEGLLCPQDSATPRRVPGGR